MKTPGLLLAVLLPGLLVAPLAACSSSSSGRLSYAQVQSLNPGVPASWVLQEFPQGRPVRSPDGKVRSIRYSVTDPHGSSQTLELEFDCNEILSRKRYSGRVIRPGGAHSKPSSL